MTDDEEPIEPEKTAETEEGDAQSAHVLINVGSSMAGSSGHVLVNAGKQGLIEGGTGDEGQEGGRHGMGGVCLCGDARLILHGPAGTCRDLHGVHVCV